ncbi:hypothetical protein HUJ05_010347 [Dendroctonus ponderosae]|nr:hypothetical protein HUJ05_010347 [Dendroctonus ponderosae]
MRPSSNVARCCPMYCTSGEVHYKLKPVTGKCKIIIRSGANRFKSGLSPNWTKLTEKNPNNNPREAQI